MAFLRGINVGGRHRLQMEDLRQAFASWGFQNVKTLLASGNVIFDAPGTDPNALAATVRKRIYDTFAVDTRVQVRTLDQIKALVDQDPFSEITVTQQTRLYVTFLSGSLPSGWRVPGESPEKDYKILSVSAGAVCSVVTLNRQGGSIKAMDLLEKALGKDITTRNWNTITRIAKMPGDTS